MTVCIAAVCLEDGEPRIALCSDTRLSQGDWGSTDLTPKFDVIGRGWVAHFANRPDSSHELAERIKEWFRSAKDLDTVNSVLVATENAVREFRNSPLCEPSCCELLLTGFVGFKPIVICVQDNARGKLGVRVAESFAAIGSGSNIATVLLNCRGYDQRESIQNAAYMIYEAKRWSEKAEGVGPLTALMFQSPGAANEPERAGVCMVSTDGLKSLVHRPVSPL